MFEMLLWLFKSGKLSETLLENAVSKKWITENEKNNILIP
ncbi:hypothetical protein SAMN05443270_2991 [Lacrimispora sphenoides]|nr:hypothetical protein SAMN05443270_2991 [Lacrimispora sphenoides]